MPTQSFTQNYTNRLVKEIRAIFACDNNREFETNLKRLIPFQNQIHFHFHILISKIQKRTLFRIPFILHCIENQCIFVCNSKNCFKFRNSSFLAVPDFEKESGYSLKSLVFSPQK